VEILELRPLTNFSSFSRRSDVFSDILCNNSSGIERLSRRCSRSVLVSGVDRSFGSEWSSAGLTRMGPMLSVGSMQGLLEGPG